MSSLPQFSILIECVPDGNNFYCSFDFLTFVSLAITFNAVSDYFVFLVIFLVTMEDNLVLKEQ